MQEDGAEGFYVLRVDEVQPSRIKPMEEAREILAVVSPHHCAAILLELLCHRIRSRRHGEGRNNPIVFP